jgi:hypothetical protein
VAVLEANTAEPRRYLYGDMNVGNIRNSAADGVADLRRNDAQYHARIRLGNSLRGELEAMLARWLIFAGFVGGTLGHPVTCRTVIISEVGASF